tara:strand:- start:129 stop:566 length:438 start_codon:yes stop_codon:yes gene_type:complete
VENELKTNHNARVVTLATGERVLCLFGEVRSEDQEKVIGYRMLYPYTLSLGDVNPDDGTIPIRYERWCPFSPIEEHRIGGEHILTCVFPDNGILDNYVSRLHEIGLSDEQIFFEVNDGEPAAGTDSTTDNTTDTSTEGSVDNSEG